MDLEAMLKEAEENTENLQPKNTYEKDERMLVPKTGKSYIIRLVPDLKNKVLFREYNWYSFKSLKNDWSINLGGRPEGLANGEFYVEKVRNALFEKEDKERGKVLYPVPVRYVNILLVHTDDEEYKEKIGELMVLRYKAKPQRSGAPRSGSPLHKLFLSAEEEYGKTKVFSLSKEGISFFIKTEKTKHGPDYDKCKAVGKGTELDSAFKGYTDKKALEVYKNAFDLGEFEVKPLEESELKKRIDEHLLLKSSSDSISIETGDDDEELPNLSLEDDEEEKETPSPKPSFLEDDDEDDDFDLGEDDESEEENEKEETVEEQETEQEEEDDLDSLFDELDDD